MMKSFLLPLLCVAATSALGIPSNDLLVGKSEIDKRNPIAIIIGMAMTGAAGNSAAQVVNMKFDDSLPFVCLLKVNVQTLHQSLTGVERGFGKLSDVHYHSRRGKSPASPGTLVEMLTVPGKLQCRHHP